MRKEIIISILIGLILGLVITYGFYSAKIATTEENVTKKDEIAQATSSAEESTSSKLVVTSPEDELVIESGDIKISGSVNAGNFIVVFVDDTPSILEVDTTTNKFDKSIKLSEGPHIIIITALDENGDTTVEERTVIVRPESEKTIEASDSAETATPTPSKNSKITPTPTKKSTKVPTPTPTNKP